MTKIPKNLLDYIQTESRKIEYGEITINFRGNDRSPEVIVSRSKRFKNPVEKKVEGKKQFNNG